MNAAVDLMDAERDAQGTVHNGPPARVAAMTRRQTLYSFAGMFVLAVSTTWLLRTASVPANTVPATSVGVAPFDTPGPGSLSSLPSALADSLADRLSRIPGLTVRSRSGTVSTAEFVVRGEVAVREGQLVIHLRLHRRGMRNATWTATFWRENALTSGLVSDLAGSIGEAIYGQLALGAVTTEKKP